MPRWTFWACKRGGSQPYRFARHLRLGGMALNDAAMDTRVKAVATSVMYDMSRAMGHGVGDGKDRYTTADRRAVLQYLNAQRWKDAANGTSAPVGMTYMLMIKATSALPIVFCRKACPPTPIRS